MVSYRHYGRYWGVILAFGWLILCGAQPPKEQPKSANGSQPTAPAVVAPFVPYPGYNPDPCYYAQGHDAADLCAQWRAAVAAEKAAHEARRAGNWSVVATLLSALAIGGLFVTIYQGRVANRIASDTAKKQLRAYVGIDEVIAEAIAGAKGEQSNTRILVFLKNYGQTPSYVSSTIGVWFNELASGEGAPVAGQRIFYPPSKRASIGADINLSDAEWAALDEETAALHIVGTVESDDIYGKMTKLDFHFVSNGRQLREGKVRGYKP